MRILLTIAAATGLLVPACSSETVAQPPPAPVDWHSFEVRATVDAGRAAPTARERAVAETYAAALASPGFAQLPALVDDDARFIFAGMDDAHGRSSVVHAHDVLFGAFDQRSVTTSRIWRTDSSQGVEWTLTGVLARTWMGVAATHKPVTFKGLTLLWTKDDGSITELHVYFDVAVVKGQLGVGPKDLVSLAPSAPPSGPPQDFEQTGSADEKNNIALARAVLDALENNDLPAYEAAVADNVEVFTLERPQPAHGKEDARAYFKAMHRAIGQLDTTVSNAWGIGPFAVLEYDIAGEQLGNIGWIPTQRDRVIRLHLVDVVEIEAGKVARIWRYDNPGEIVAAKPG
jgi:ketosteroid isomerase-like protein